MLNWARQSRGLSRSFLLFFLCLMLTGVSLGLAGCAQGQDTGKGEETEAQSPRLGRKVAAPQELFYLIENPLVLTRTETEQADTSGAAVGIPFRESKLSVSGLLDKTVETKINQKLEETYAALKEAKLPGYRGIKTVIKEGEKPKDAEIFVSDVWNCNNILSVILDRIDRYALGTDDFTYVVQRRTLNFDLNSGEEIPLASLFGDNIKDYMDKINDYAAKTLLKRGEEGDSFRESSDSYSLVTPFKGFSEDQRYYLMDDGLVFVLDDETPGFTTGFSGNVFVIPWEALKSQTVYGSRFYDEKGTDLYESQEAPVKRLLQSQGENLKGISTYEDRENLSISLQVRYFDGIPKSLQEEMEGFCVLDQEKLSMLQKELAVTSKMGYYEQRAYLSQVGPCYVLDVNYTMGSGEGMTQIHQGTVYDRKTMEKMSLSEVFRDGYDPLPLLEKKLGESLALYEIPKEEQDTESLLSVATFSVNSSGLNLMVPVAKDQDLLSIDTWVDFKEIGCENLTLF